MNPSAFSRCSTGVVVFLTAAALGWKLAPPPAATETPAARNPARETKRQRPPRAPRSAAAEAAAQRMAALHRAKDSQARMLATLALANSISPADFAAWRDQDWFDLRGGPELMVFHNILMDRWQREDPEGLLTWALANRNGAANQLAKEWAANDPQRLLAYFKLHPNPATEIEMLANVAAGAPDLALQRLVELVAAGLPVDALESSGELLEALAGKSPAELERILESLPPALKSRAEVALSKQRLNTSFPDEIRALWNRPDGWQIFAEASRWNLNFGLELLGELDHLPPAWRTIMARNPWSLVAPSNAAKWLDADLAAAGFTPSETAMFRKFALHALASENPADAIERLDQLDFSEDFRAEFLRNAFSHGEPGNLRTVANQLSNSEERENALAILDQRAAPEPDRKVAGPDDLLAKIAGLDPDSYGNGSYFAQTDNWKPEALAALSASFGALPDDQKAKAAAVISNGTAANTAPQSLQGEAIRYLIVENDANSHPMIARSSEYAVTLSEADPVAAAAWVESLPPGETKWWTSKNLIENWRQYDPKAAAAWEKKLSPEERAEISRLPFEP